MAMNFDDLIDSVKQGLGKAQNKFEEVKNAEETQRFMKNAKEKAISFGEKAKDVGIDVGLKTAEIAEELSGRAVEAMQKASAKRDAAKAAKDSEDMVVYDAEAKDVTEE